MSPKELKVEDSMHLPVALLESTTVDSADPSVNGIDGQLIWSKTNDRPKTSMSGVDRRRVVLLLSVVKYP
jgi:hypothetical protein